MRQAHLSILVTRFIEDNIQSVEQLEILILLAAHPEKTWTAESVSKELRSSPRSVERWLRQLSERRLITTENDSYGMHPDLKELVQQVSEAYATYRVSIIEMIFSRPQTRLQTLADAFKFRKDP